MINQASNSPLISIILPVHNAGYYLSSCLDSILKQSYEHFEIIAIDDLSRDDSWKILKLYRSLDKRIKIYRNIKKYGKYITLNRILRKTKRQYVVFMDAKDMMYKDKLKKQLSFLMQHKKAVAVGTQCTFLSQDNKRIGISSYPHENDAIYHQPIHGISVHFETLMVNKYLLPKDLLYFTNNDKILYSSLLVKLLTFGQIINLPFALQYQREHKEVSTSPLKHLSSLLQLGIQSLTEQEYRPSIRKYLYNTFWKPTFTSSQ
jgi:cellulose synthase/poly-beta-1,6-N-acetylglucosamine synthase-like glycosyltransferase